MKNNRLLYGGALMAAGLAAQAAKADAVFIFSDTDVEVNAYDPGDAYAYQDTHCGAGFWSLYAEVAHGPQVAYASSESTADTLRLRADSNIIGWAEVNLTWCYFTVSEAATGLVSWDFGEVGDDFFLWNSTDRVDLVNVNSDDPTGKQQVSLEIGKVYFIRSGVTAREGVAEKSFVDFVLFAPSCPWDLDGNNNVGTGDLILLLGSWGDPYGTADLIELLGNWGACPQ